MFAHPCPPHRLHSPTSFPLFFFNCVPRTFISTSSNLALEIINMVRCLAGSIYSNYKIDDAPGDDPSKHVATLTTEINGGSSFCALFFLRLHVSSKNIIASFLRTSLDNHCNELSHTHRELFFQRRVIIS